MGSTAPPEPVTNFSGTPLTGEIPLTVTFTDSSTNTPTSWLWDFGDSGTSTDQNPTHEYTTVDSFTVTLTTENAGGEDDEIKTDYITTSMTTPTGLTVDNILTTSMKLNWNPVAGTDHYEVYLDGVLVDDTITDEFYTFTGLTESTEYELGVKAVDASDNASTMATITESTASIVIPAMFAYYPLQTDSVETIGSAFDSITLSTSASKSLSVNAQSGATEAFTFSYDGTKVYSLANDTAIIYQYTLSTAWDTSTGSYATKSYDATEAGGDARAIRVSNDGTKMYILSNTNNAIYQYTLSTPGDVTTASYANKSLSVNGQSTTPVGMCFNSDFSKVYVLEATNDTIYQYDLSTAEDISTGSYATKSFQENQEATPYGIYITNNNKLFIIGTTNKSVYQYTITNGDISTASYDSVSVNTSIIVTDVYVKEDLKSFYVIGEDIIYQFNNISRNGTDTSITYSSGAVCNATNDKIALAQGVHIPPNAWSYSFWFNVSNVATEQRIGFNDSVGNYFLILSLFTSKVKFYFYDTDNTGKTGTGSTTLSNNTWYLYTVTITQNGNALLYLNNVTNPEATIAIKGKKAIGSNRGNNLCNDYSTTPNNAFVGTVSKFRIFNTILTTDEIGKIYDEGQ